MTNKQTFILKDSPPELISVAEVEPKGRSYDKSFSEQPGAVRIDDVVLGMKFASLAITDDKEGTLKKIGKANPWHIEALKIITGSEEEAHKPLSTILSKHMGVTCDKIIDEHGLTANGQFLDTQGYIAHNDEVVVLAYRCTTSPFDWLTNLSTTSSAWEPEVDLAKGHSGFFSGLEGLCCYEGEYRPRVHTGFYNNFLATAPFVQQYIEPLLQPDQPPRKLYVVGHSLGAGIATMAACYFLLSLDWAQLPHKICVITAGSPRACQKSMREKIQEKMNVLRPLNKAVICRIVRDRDVVPTLPPALFGFTHLDKLVYITDDGEILINPKVDDEHIIDQREMKSLLEQNPSAAVVEDDESDAQEEAEQGKSKKEREKSKYERIVSKIPRPFRDHMPDFYLTPLIKLFERDAEFDHAVNTSVDHAVNTSAAAIVEGIASKSAAKNNGDDDPVSGSDTALVKRKGSSRRKVSSFFRALTPKSPKKKRGGDVAMSS